MPDGKRPTWTFLTNHGHVLVCIARDPGIRGRDIAEQVGITERSAQAIVGDLVEAGYVQRTRVGRRNHYVVNLDLPVRHPVEQPHRVGELLDALGSEGARSARPARRAADAAGPAGPAYPVGAGRGGPVSGGRPEAPEPPGAPPPAPRRRAPRAR